MLLLSIDSTEAYDTKTSKERKLIVRYFRESNVTAAEHLSEKVYLVSSKSASCFS